MQLKILVPSGVFADIANVARIVVITQTGSFGLLPHRLDCAAVLAPGLFTYSTAGGEEVHIATDTGLLIKTGTNVLVCVRQAVAGADLGHLRQAVEQQMLHLSAQETSDRATLAHLEGGLIRAFVELQRV